MYPEFIYSAPFFAASLSVFALALYAFRQRSARSATCLVLVCITGAFWAASEGMLYLGLDIETSIFITYLQSLVLAALAPITLFFILSFFGLEAWLTRTGVALLIGMAMATAISIWTNPIHHLVYRDFYSIETGPFPMLGLDHGPVWWLITGYNYALTVLMSIILLSKVITSSGIQRYQAGIILAAECGVWAANAVYITGNSPLPNMDIGPLAFIFVALSMGVGVFRYRIFDILPVAKTEIINALRSPLLVIDTQERVLDLNSAAGQLFNLSMSKTVGLKIGHLFKDRPYLAELLREPRTREICLHLQGRQRYFDFRVTDYIDKRGMKIGRIFFLHDNTEYKEAGKALRERERLKGVLEMAGAVSLDLAAPIKALFDVSHQVLKSMPEDHPEYPKILKLVEQTRRLKEKTRKLMKITRYETRDYLDKTIVDIDKAAVLGGSVSAAGPGASTDDRMATSFPEEV
jgi:PAS domain-containing protein